MKRGLLLFVCLNLSATASEPEPKVGERLPRRGDEIIVCGQLYHTTTKVVTWMDPGGYDAYRVGRRFAARRPGGVPGEGDGESNSNASERGSARYNLRTRGLTKEQIERVRGGGWDVPLLQQVVDQFVIHFDVCGTSRRCFEVLQDKRGLSVHFMLDIDGTIYQTLDLKERAWHATIANDRSIGIEVANMGAYGLKETNPLGEWYQPDSEGRVRLVIPGTAKAGDPVAAVAAGLRPSRPDKVVGPIHGGLARAVRLHAAAIRGAGQAHGHALHGLPQDPLRLPAGRQGDVDHARSYPATSTTITTASSGTSTCRTTRWTRARRSSGTG